MEPEKASGIRELDALTEGVDRLGRSLAEQERLRKRLMTDVAHELRTPTAVVKAQLEAMADGVWDPSPERLALCVAEVDRLSDLIAEVEQVAILEGDAAELRREPLRLEVFLEGVVDSFRPLFERSGVALSWTPVLPLEAELDAGRFRHVMENLLSNALRHTEPGGRVEVRLDRFVDAQGGESARISVEDAGCGIAPDDLPHVFDRFYRADFSRSRSRSRSRARGGHGVGLAIAKAAVEAHGGSISVQSKEGSGSVFTILLPMSGRGRGKVGLQ